MKIFIKNKKPFSKRLKGCKVLAPQARQNDFRNFCISDDTEKVYQKLEEIINA
jgi:hypothetical protein